MTVGGFGRMWGGFVGEAFKRCFVGEAFKRCFVGEAFEGCFVGTAFRGALRGEAFKRCFVGRSSPWPSWLLAPTIAVRSLRSGLPPRHLRCGLRPLPSDSLGRIEVARSHDGHGNELPMSGLDALLELWSGTRRAGPAELLPPGRRQSAYAAVVRGRWTLARLRRAASLGGRHRGGWVEMGGARRRADFLW
ncbi:Uncharacterised protein [Achromobacter kerstersii]|nr:Uncharacterised protein [Achromobacter kerstersii]